MTSNAWPITVPLSACCGVLPGDRCDCAAWHAEALAAFDAPILLPPPSPLPVLTDPALNVWRPGPDMVEAMCPPLRWSMTGDTVSVSLGVNP